MENKNYIWRPVSEYTGGRVLATNGLDVIIGEINSEGDCESEEDGSTILCGITGFIKIEEILPELKESEGESIKKELVSFFKNILNRKGNEHSDADCKRWIAWLEKQGEQGEIDYDEELKRCKANPIYFFDKYVKVKLKEQKPAWSEEDEEMYKRVETAIDSYYAPFSRDAEEMSEWFKSLKERYAWRPSDEQMKALKEAVDEHFDIDGGALWHLYEDLKKLRKE